MKKRRINWKNVMILLSAVLLILTPLFSYWTTLDRGYFAVGGEYLIWMFPFVAIFFIDTFEELKNEAI